MKNKKEIQYAQKVKEHIIQALPPEQLGGLYHGISYPHICKELRFNFIDGNPPAKCDLKGELCNSRPLPYHQYACHLNSSQILCISFFKKFFEEASYEDLLLSILRTAGLSIPENICIVNACFEYEPSPKERTNFDFYLELSDGRHISFEIKYTETEFGSIRPCPKDKEKYGHKWQECYLPLTQTCPYFKESSICSHHFQCVQFGKFNLSCPEHQNCSIFEFYSHYQISRNIVFAKKPEDIVVFLTPRENHSLDHERQYIDLFANKHNTTNILNLYWEDLLEITLSATQSCPKLFDYFQQLKKKYFLYNDHMEH